MSSISPVNHFDINDRLLGVVGISITDEVSRKYKDFISSLFYCFGLDYKSLPEVHSTDGSPTSFSSEERRLRGMLRESITLINELATKIAELTEQNGTYATDAVSLSTKTKDMAALLSTQNAEIENHYTEVAELQQEVNALAAQLEALKIQHVDDMLGNDTNEQLLESSAETVARLRETVARLQATIRNRERIIETRDREMIGLNDCIDANTEYTNSLRYKLSVADDLINDLKRGASEEINNTSPKQQKQGSSCSNDAPSPSDVTIFLTNQILDSDAPSEEEPEVDTNSLFDSDASSEEEPEAKESEVDEPKAVLGSQEHPMILD